MKQLSLIPLEKRCEICKEIKPLNEFREKSRGKFGREFACIPCYREYQRKYQKKTYTPEKGRAKNLKQFYGLNEERYWELHQQQNGLCACCKRAETFFDQRTNSIQRLAVDHNHKTGEVRALLCVACNTSFGALNEDPDRIRMLLLYAEKVKAQEG